MPPPELIQILFHLFQTVYNDFFCSFIDTCHQSIHEMHLQSSSLFNNGRGFFCTEKQCFAPVGRCCFSDQIAFAYKPVYVDRDQICFDLPKFHNIAGCPVFRIVSQKQQNIKGCLRQMQGMA